MLLQSIVLSELEKHTNNDKGLFVIVRVFRDRKGEQ